jgi:hypothetical protein
MRGMLMFVHNNDLFDYGKMAYASALAAKHHLKVPISIVSDHATWEKLLRDHGVSIIHIFDRIILIDHHDTHQRHFALADGSTKKAKYHNTSRLDAYKLSPYKETLLLDTDVLIQDNSLQHVWGSSAYIRMNHEISELVLDAGNTQIKFSDKSLTTFWATICYFRKCKVTEDFFALSKYVEEHYEYYGTLYGFPTTLVRVDYIMTIAAHIMSGYVGGAKSVVEPLPVEDTMFAWNKDILIDVDEGRTTFLTKYHGRDFPVSTYRTVHCMNKDSLVNMADKIIDTYAIL